MKKRILATAGVLIGAVLLSACGGGSSPSAGGVTDVPHASVVVEENIAGTVFELASGSEALAYNLGGPDAGNFQIDALGVVSLIDALDFESPGDQNSDNSYEVEIYWDASALPGQRLSLQVEDQLIFDDPTLTLAAGSGQISLAVAIDDPLASTYRLRISVDPDGGSGFTPMDSNRDGLADADDVLPSSTTALSLPNHAFDPAFSTRLYMIEALDESGDVIAASGSVGPSGLSANDLIQYIKANNTDADDYFGWVVALSGDGSTLAIGARNEDGSGVGVEPSADNGISNAGAVYVYRHDGEEWLGPQYIKSSNTGLDDAFGHALALSADGNTLAVGAYAEDGGGTGVGASSDDSANDAGAVYVYRYDGSAWLSPQYIKASNTGANDQFGRAVALSGDGNALAVAAAGEASGSTGVGAGVDESANEAGAVYVYRYDGSVWQPPQFIKASNTGAGDKFGASIALSSDGSTLAVGAIYEDGSGTGTGAISDDSTSNAGAVYVYKYDGSTWLAPQYIKASNSGLGDYFGYAVALSGDGNAMAVGAIFEDGNGVGVGSATNDGAIAAGAVYLYHYDGSAWQNPHYIKASNTGAGDNFGCAVALSTDGITLAVGAYGEQGSGAGLGSISDDTASLAGAVYVYRHDGSGWQASRYIKASNTGIGDYFGSAVSLSGDGRTLAIGADGEDGSGSGVGASSDDGAAGAGAVYVY